MDFSEVLWKKLGCENPHQVISYINSEDLRNPDVIIRMILYMHAYTYTFLVFSVIARNRILFIIK